MNKNRFQELIKNQENDVRNLVLRKIWSLVKSGLIMPSCRKNLLKTGI